MFFLATKKGTAFLVFGLEPCGVEANHNRKMKENKEEYITLLDGRKLMCYPRVEPTAPIDNSTKLDTTGEYLTLKHRTHTATEPTEEEMQRRQEAKKFFTDHAFFFLDHRKQILNDSRMFLAPVPVQSGIAYTGTSGFQCPTLGVYIEWWLNCAPAIIGRYRKESWLVYHISGSPLSGSNQCGIVNPKGECRCERIPGRFRNLWAPFVDTNTRYDEAKQRFEAYSLEKVVELLKDSDEGDSLTERELYILQRENTQLRNELLKLRDESKRSFHDMRTKLLKAYFECNRDELSKWYAEYCKEKCDKEQEISELKQRQRELRHLLKSGEINNKFYQQQLTPLKKQVQAVEDQINRIGLERLSVILRDGYDWNEYDMELIARDESIKFLNGQL